MLQQNREQISVFYDQLSLQRGNEYDVDFCSGIARSLVALPVLSVHALNRMCDEVAITSASTIDNVLLEWMAMLALKASDHVPLRRVVPIILGETWPDKSCAAQQWGVATMARLVEWVQTQLTDKPAAGTVRRLREILPRLGLPASAGEGVPVSPRGVVTALLRFDAIVRMTSSPPPTSHLGAAQSAGDWKLFEGIADEVRVLVDGLKSGPVPTSNADGPPVGAGVQHGTMETPAQEAVGSRFSEKISPLG
jgi:hypothetical protein